MNPRPADYESAALPLSYTGVSIDVARDAQAYHSARAARNQGPLTGDPVHAEKNRGAWPCATHTRATGYDARGCSALDSVVLLVRM